MTTRKSSVTRKLQKNSCTHPHCVGGEINNNIRFYEKYGADCCLSGNKFALIYGMNNACEHSLEVNNDINTQEYCELTKEELDDFYKGFVLQPEYSDCPHCKNQA